MTVRHIVLLALSLLLLSSCRPPNNSSSSSNTDTTSGMVRVELAENPKMGESPISVFILDGADGVSGAQVEITGDMTHAGMVPVIVDAVESEAGLYLADDFAFTMAGDWIVTTEITLSDGEKLMDETKVTVSAE